MSPILFGGSENRDESGCCRPAEEKVCKAVFSKHALKAYDDCCHRAIQRTLLLKLERGFCVIIRHFKGGDVRDGITEGEDTGWRRRKDHGFLRFKPRVALHSVTARTPRGLRRVKGLESEFDLKLTSVIR